MLEVKNLRKEYKSKKGVVTKALDDVSLTFPETGMVFILGKSGSGKSTLLNVCGGLDRMDSGEIIIKGKSSKSFSGQDFDSYRNTYVGFVFQEYNILDEFTVEENIALALELQNKKRDKKVIEQILTDVDMTEFAKRKPNTLSGGQKQRVAIARALVKEPQIIMADEPTGALDSKTGQQVFDTLKKLSETKLVIVISHDRDFAEQYGDRIIELKDGKIISDQTRATEGENAKNVRFFGTDTVTVNSGAELTDEDLLKIKNFLSKSGGAAVISTSREKITQMKEDRPEISVGAFENIKEQPQSKQYEPQKLIRSHLPVRHAFKMGASGLKTKPIRLMFTILLSVVAFILFGLVSTLMLFDGREVTVQTFVDSDTNKIMLNKIYYETYDWGDGDTYTEQRDTTFTEEEYNALLAKYPGAIASVRVDRSIGNLSLSSAASSFYNSRVENAVAATNNLSVLAGRLPTADDEVAITDFMVDMFKSSGSRFVYGANKTELNVSDYGSVIYSDSKPVTLEMGGTEYKIVGVFKGMNVVADYQTMKSAADSGNTNDSFGFGMFTWEQERQKGMFNTVAVTRNVFEQLGLGGASSEGFDVRRYFKESSYHVFLEHVNGNQEEFSRLSKYEGAKLPLYNLDGTEKPALTGSEIAISYDNMFVVLRLQYDLHYDDMMGSSTLDDEAKEQIRNIKESFDYYRDENENMSSEEVVGMISRVYSVLKECDYEPKVELFGSTHSARPVNVAFFYHRGDTYNSRYCMYMSEDLYLEFYKKPQWSGGSTNSKYETPDGAYISTIFIPFDGDNHTSARIKQLLDITDTHEADDSGLIIGNGIKSQIDSVVRMAGDMEEVFIIVGIVFAVFAFLMMFNFISASITAKKKEIGILRAIGARTLDVFKIFLSEAFIIALICFAISAGGAFGLCIFLNSMLASDVGLSASLFVFGPISILCVFGIAFVTAIIATILPVALYSRKPPIASIRAL